MQQRMQERMRNTSGTGREVLKSYPCHIAGRRPAMTTDLELEGCHAVWKAIPHKTDIGGRETRFGLRVDGE